MKIKSVVYRKGFVEIEFSRGGNVWATLVIKPKDIIDNFHAAKQGMQRTAFGAGWHVRLANKIIGFGWWLADNGNR